MIWILMLCDLGWVSKCHGVWSIHIFEMEVITLAAPLAVVNVQHSQQK